MGRGRVGRPMEMKMAFFLDTGWRGPLEPSAESQLLEARRQGWLVWAFTLIRLRRKWAADRRALRGMGAQLRRDIGVTPAALQAEFRRSFWGDPAVRSVRPGWPFNRRR